ncbi:MAG: reverse transcriptase domain-containing protein [Pseudomonadota bacterium]
MRRPTRGQGRAPAAGGAGLLRALGLTLTPPWERWASATVPLGSPVSLDLARALTPAVFEAAWRRARTPGGAGVDGRGRAWFERDLSRHLGAIRAAVIAGRWRPAPLLHRRIPKPDGTERQLGIPTLADRLVQSAVLEVVGPRVEALLRPWVHGYRPGHSPAGAVRQLVGQVGLQPWLELVKVDIEGLFDHLAHPCLERMILALSPDPLWRSLNRAWLRAWPTGPDRGVPQGAPLSPLLANLYLHHALDLPLERARVGLEDRALSLCGQIRYADDIALAGAARGSGVSLLTWTEGVLGRAGLRLSPTKTVARCSAATPAPLILLGLPVSITAEGQGYRLRATIAELPPGAAWPPPLPGYGWQW